MSVTKLLAAALLVVSPATFGLAAYTGALDLSSEESPDTFGGDVVAEWEKELSETMATGELDLRIDRGMVRVIGWDQPAYHIMVVEAPNADSQLSDDGNERVFNDNSRDDHLNLSLLVDDAGTYTVSTDGTSTSVRSAWADRAIIAYVPSSIAYERVFACSGQRPAVIDTVDQLTGDTIRIGYGDETCVAQETSSAGLHTVAVDTDGQEHKKLNVTFGLEDLNGKEAVLRSQYSDMTIDRVEMDKLWAENDYGDLEITESSFKTVNLEVDYGHVAMDAQAEDLDIEADYGDVEVNGIDAKEATIDASYGNVDLTGNVNDLDVEADYGDVTIIGDVGEATFDVSYGDLALEGALDEATIEVDYGDVTLVLDPRASGEIDVEADYGNILVQVPARDAIGYAVDAQTDYGSVEIALEDAHVSSDQEDDDNEQHVVARTNGFEDRPLKVRMGLEASYGDVTVTDGSEPVEPEEEDDEGHGHERVPSGIDERSRVLRS